jgi:hypothetical protein
MKRTYTRIDLKRLGRNSRPCNVSLCVLPLPGALGLLHPIGREIQHCPDGGIVDSMGLQSPAVGSQALF